MDKILILGSEGFTGRYFLEFLKRTKKKGEAFLIDKFIKSQGTDVYSHSIDLTQRKEIFQFLKERKPTLIFNFVGLNSGHKLEDFFKFNVQTAENLLSSIQEIPNYVPKVLLVGSAAEYGIIQDSCLPVNECYPTRPISNYGLSKSFLNILAEKYISQSKIRIYRARPFNIIGPLQSEKLFLGSISLQLAKIKEGRQPPELYVGNINSARDFIDIRDVVSSYWDIVNSDYHGEIFNVGSGRPAKTTEIIEFLIKISGLKIKIVQRRKLLKKYDPPVIYADTTKIRTLLRWEPKISLEHSLEDIWKAICYWASG